MKTTITAVLAAAIITGTLPVRAEEWTPDPRSVQELVFDLREFARRELGVTDPMRTAIGKGCHTVARASDYVMVASVDASAAYVQGPSPDFAKSLDPKRAGTAGMAVAFVDAHGGMWIESPLAQIRREGRRGPGGFAAPLTPSHAGYLLSWPGEDQKGCTGSNPEVTIIRDSHEMSRAMDLIARQKYARDNKGGQPTAKPRTEPPSA